MSLKTQLVLESFTIWCKKCFAFQYFINHCYYIRDNFAVNTSLLMTPLSSTVHTNEMLDYLITVT